MSAPGSIDSATPTSWTSARPLAARSRASSCERASRRHASDAIPIVGFVVLETPIRPSGPYSLRLSARLATDATRQFRNGRLTVALPGGEVAGAWQRPDGIVLIRSESEAGLDRLRFVLGFDDDHSEFLERFAD